MGDVTARPKHPCPRCGEPAGDTPHWDTPGDGHAWHYLCLVKTGDEKRLGEPAGSERIWGPFPYDKAHAIREGWING